MPVTHIKNSSEYDALLTKHSKKLVIVDFTAKWCGPCQRIAPIYEELSDKYRNSVFLKVDVDENQDIAQDNQVQAMPTFLFIKDNKEIDRQRGGDPDSLEEKVKKLGGGSSQPSFEGEGHRLSESSLSSSAPSPQASSSIVEDAQKSMEVDESKPTGKVNIRMADGSRFTVTLNLTQPVSKVREFICKVRPDQSGRGFGFITTFPSKEVEFEHVSIQEANIANAVVLQKLT